MQHWYALHTKPRQEQRALEHLQRQGYEAYCPLIRERRGQRGEYRWLIAPMFPRYLFLHLRLGRDNIASLRSTRGVCGLVQFGGHIPPVPEEFIIGLQRHDANGTDVVQTLQSAWQPGQRVQIEEGPFAGLQAIFQARQGQDRVLVLLDLLGRQVPMRLTERCLA
jgi:transcriptional antiterminator RfaH